MRQKNIAEFMSAFGKKNYTPLDVSEIESGYRRFQLQYRKQGIRSERTKKAFEENNVRLSEYLCNKYAPQEVKLFKKCVSLEYEDRTGKSAFGFKGYKERNGFGEG